MQLIMRFAHAGKKRVKNLLIIIMNLVFIMWHKALGRKVIYVTEVIQR